MCQDANMNNRRNLNFFFPFKFSFLKKKESFRSKALPIKLYHKMNELALMGSTQHLIKSSPN